MSSGSRLGTRQKEDIIICSRRLIEEQKKKSFNSREILGSLIDWRRKKVPTNLQIAIFIQRDPRFKKMSDGKYTLRAKYLKTT